MENGKKEALKDALIGMAVELNNLDPETIIYQYLKHNFPKIDEEQLNQIAKIVNNLCKAVALKCINKQK